MGGMHSEPSDAVALDVVRAHVDAFNAGDVDALMAGFADDAVFVTAEHMVVGIRGLRAMFGDALASLSPTMELRATIVQHGVVACELTEHLTVDGAQFSFQLAAFYTVQHGQIVRVKVYREGTEPAQGSAGDVPLA
jgi:uncharacterized protein